MKELKSFTSGEPIPTKTHTTRNCSRVSKKQCKYLLQCVTHFVEPLLRGLNLSELGFAKVADQLRQPVRVKRACCSINAKASLTAA